MKIRLALVFVCALIAAPSPATAWSFSSLFGGDDDESGAGSKTASQAGTTEDGSDLSDGSDVNVTQPLLKPTDWFITEEEIVASRGGVPRDGLQTFTTGNNVTVYTVPNEFFTAVDEDFSATKAGDRVMYTGWDTCVIPFEPDIDPTGAKTGFDVMFKGIVERGGSVHLLSWSNYLLTSQNTKARDAINSIPPSKVNGAQALYLFDDRVPLVASAHHPKTIVIAANESTDEDEHPVTYVGGMDLTNDRWDTIYHNNPAIPNRANIRYRNNGWVDVWWFYKRTPTGGAGTP